MGMLSDVHHVPGTMFSWSCFSSWKIDGVLVSLSGIMTGGALASGSLFGKSLHDALEGFWSKGTLVVKRGKDGFFLGSIFGV